MWYQSQETQTNKKGRPFSEPTLSQTIIYAKATGVLLAANLTASIKSELTDENSLTIHKFYLWLLLLNLY